MMRRLLGALLLLAFSLPAYAGTIFIDDGPVAVAAGGGPLAVETTSNSTAQSNVTSITVSHTVTASNKLVATVCSADGTIGERTVSSITFNGAGFTLVKAKDDGGFERAEIWQLNGPATGTHDLVVTFGGNCEQSGAGVTGFTNANATLGTAGENTAATINPTVTVPSTAGDIVVSILCSDLGNDQTTTENGTLLWELEDAGGGDSDFNAQRQVAAGASTVAGWTAAAPLGGAWAAAGVAVKP